MFQNASLFFGLGCLGLSVEEHITSESDDDMIMDYKSTSTNSEIFRAAGSFIDRAPDAFGRKVEVVQMMRLRVGSYLSLAGMLTCKTILRATRVVR
jgi:hypothetical protein